eukprot:53299-Eustigmatos_ZCMA.PRE.1
MSSPSKCAQPFWHSNTSEEGNLHCHARKSHRMLVHVVLHCRHEVPERLGREVKEVGQREVLQHRPRKRVQLRRIQRKHVELPR